MGFLIKSIVGGDISLLAVFYYFLLSESFYLSVARSSTSIYGPPASLIDPSKAI